jgi:hypothetical protein
MKVLCPVMQVLLQGKPVGVPYSLRRRVASELPACGRLDTPLLLRTFGRWQARCSGIPVLRNPCPTRGGPLFKPEDVDMVTSPVELLSSRIRPILCAGISRGALLASIVRLYGI